MDAILPWGVVALVLIAPLPWVLWLMRDSLLLALLTALALGVGALTLLMFWGALAGVALDPGWVTGVYLLLMLPGAVLLWRNRPNLPAPRPPQSIPARVAMLIIAGVGSAVLFNAIYWPFSRADVLGIYEPAARQMTATRALVPLPGADTLYEAYPILIPLTYTYAFQLAGWQHEYLARVFPALLSLGCIGAAFLLGDALRGRAAAYAGALVMALTPTFARWASAGYVDLPMAFFYAMMAVFMLRLWRAGRARDALLAGIMLGLAVWTKNAALIGVPLLALALLWGVISRRYGIDRALLALAACALVGAPWYLRNLWGAGLILPDTAWTDQAQPTLANLFIYLTRPEIFGLVGPILLVGVIAAALRPRDPSAALLWWIIPFFGAWWLLVSYDPRFLLLFLPLSAALGGVALADGFAVLPRRFQPRLLLTGCALGLMLAFYSMWIGVEFKRELLHDPFMDDATRRAVVMAER